MNTKPSPNRCAVSGFADANNHPRFDFHHGVIYFIAACSLLFCSAAFAADDDGQTLDLRPQPLPGRISRYEVWTLRTQNITVRNGGQNQSLSTRMELTGQVTWAVDRVKPDGSSNCVMTLDWLTASLTMPDGSVENNDSRQAKGQSKEVHRLLRAMSGVPIQCDVAADGSIRSVSGLEPMRRKAGEGLKVPDETDFVESASDLATLAFAPAAAAVGKTWDAAFLWNHELGKIQQTVKYKLASTEVIEGITVATVKGSSQQKLLAELPNLPAGSPKLDVKLLSGTLNSQIMFDMDRHEVVGRNTLESRKIEASIRAPQQTITRVVDETVQSQALRVSEE